MTAALNRSVLHVLVCSTYSDGKLPTTACGFQRALVDQQLDLTGLRFAFFGLGDWSYHATYSPGSEILDGTFRRLGAKRIDDYGRHGAANGVSIDKRLNTGLIGCSSRKNLALSRRAAPYTTPQVDATLGERTRRTHS